VIVSLYLQLDNMSNTVAESQSSNNQNSSPTEDSKQQLNSNDGYTQRQLQSAFQPPTSVEQVADQLQSLNVTSKVTMRSDAPPFTPSFEATKTLPTTDDSETKIKTDYIYDVKKI